MQLASRCVACSSLSNKDGLGLLGLPVTESSREEQLEGAVLDLEELLPERLRQGLPTNIKMVGDLLDHYATDLYLRQLLTDPIDQSMKGNTRRELIGPALFLSAHLVENVRVLAEFAVHGARSKGFIDWLLQYFNFGILCVEGKLYDKLIEHIGQWCGEAKALRDELRAQVLGKRKRDEMSPVEEKLEQLLKEVPTAGLLTSGIHYLFLRYTESPLKLVTYQRMSLPSSIGTEQCTRAEIKSHLERLVAVIVALLKQQIKAFEEKLPQEVQSAKANKRVRKL